MAMKQYQLVIEDIARVFPKVSQKLDALSGSTVLITGGSGFVGSWIAEFIGYLNREEKANIKLYILDQNCESFQSEHPYLFDSNLIELISCDTRNLLEIPQGVNYIIHAAATPDSRFHSSYPIETMTTIADGTANVLRAANRLTNLIKFVNISSSSVYALNDQVVRISETSAGRDLNPRSASAYSEAKRYAEVLCAAARSEARIPVITVRPFTFCGAYQKLDSPWFLNNFINDALHQRPIRILGDGKSMRSLLYGADLACWLLVIMLHGHSGQILNIGSDQGKYLDELARMVALSFSPSNIIQTHTSLTGVGSNTCLVPDISAVKSCFGLDIYTDIDDAISRTVEWYRLCQVQL